MHKLIILTNVLMIAINIKLSLAFNLSPIPNYRLNLPIQNTFKEKTRSSYFGYQINLRQNSVIISAPRLQPVLESQRNINEPGGLFKCDIKTQTCEPFVMDPYGDVLPEAHASHFEGIKKEMQWFGSAIDGQSSESDSFISCAPNIVTLVATSELHYLFNGVCYLAQDTVRNATTSRLLAPLRVRRKLNLNADEKNIVYYMFGQLGLSVHITENSEEVLIGAPGVYTWKGTVIRYKTPDFLDSPGLSRRNLDNIAEQRRKNIIKFEAEIANPSYWDQKDDSYFGYAVTSGYFVANTSTLPKLLYVASAPQGNGQTGEVVVFDFAVHPNNLNDPLERTIKVYQKFLGGQMGEYFGFALLAADFNGDGLYDLAISAPFHAGKSSYDSGKVYVFLNVGEARFAEQTALVSNYEGNGRFGTTLGKIGDINHDGYNDIAVGAPYDEGGKVYIFLGGRSGIITKPSQIISAPSNPFSVNSINQTMFGHGISRGVDIDNNGFNDLAIGSPNSENVFVYRSYPVVKIQASIIPAITEISMNETKTNIKACYYYTTTKVQELPFNFDLNLTIKLDPQLNRAKFVRSGSNEFKTTVTATNREECIESEISLTYTLADIFKPVSLEIHYELAKKFQDSATFCENCVAINPAEPAMNQNKIIFSTGCKEIRCVADLKVTSKVIDTQLPFVLGSSKSLSIEYTVENGGETAYLTKIEVQIPPMASFHKVPSNCKLEDYIMLCDLVRGKPLFTNEKTTLLVTIGTARLEGKEFWIKSNVTSNSDEKFGDDNVLNYLIPLTEFSEIEILGHSTPSLVSVEEAGLIPYNIVHEFELTNSGPSNVKHMNFIVSLPLVYKTDYPIHHATLIDFKNISATGQHDGKQLDVKWSQIVDLNKPRSLQPENLIVLNSVNDMEPTTSDEPATITPFSETTTAHYNRYRREIVTSYNETHIGYTSQFDATFNNLPLNRLLYFNCSNIRDNQHHCVHAIFEIKDFRASDKTIKIKFNFTVDLSKVDLLYTEMHDIFLLVASTRIEKLNDNDGKSLRIINIDPYTIITKYVKVETPIWPILLSILIGIIVLAIVSYVLYKMGFFKRAKKEEMERLTRQSQVHTSEGEEE